jgi:hypothetical protein
LKDLAQGEQLALEDRRTIMVLADIAFSHKICLEDIPVAGMPSNTEKSSIQRTL